MNKDKVYSLLSEMLIEEGYIDYRMMDSCRCGGCYEYQLRDCDDELVMVGDTLADLAATYDK